MTKIEILSILESVLGVSRQTGKDNHAFFCPYCKHYKRKLEVNLSTFNYHCWTCEPKRGGRNFYYLVRNLHNITSTQLDKIRVYTSAPTYNRTPQTSKTNLFLPDEYRSLQLEWNSVEYKHAIVYLKDRGITEQDVCKYKIGYCESGEFSNRIIVPSFDDHNDLTYFIARDFFGGYIKYKNPTVSKDVIFFENLISWNHPIVLCEGVFDAMAIKRNAITLLGKNISSELLQMIKLKNVSDIYVCLDMDARKEALEIVSILQRDNSNRNVYLVDLPAKDPSDIGFKKISQIIKNTKKFDFKQMIYSRLFE